MLSRLQSPADLPTADLQARRDPKTSAATSVVALAAAAFAMFWPAGPFAVSQAEAKTPGKTYCFYRVCHRIMTLDETRRAVGKRMVLHASHYEDPKKDRFNPSNLTSSGEWSRAGMPDNAVSPKLPNGTVILAWNPSTRQSAVLRVNNAGPYWGNRTLDVSRAAAERLGFARQGVAKLQVEIVRAQTKEDVTYRKGRRYAAVPGPSGTHATFEMALAAANRTMGIQMPAATTLVAGLPGNIAAEREIDARAGQIPAAPASAPVVPAMPAAVAAVAAWSEETVFEVTAPVSITAAAPAASTEEVAAAASTSRSEATLAPAENAIGTPKAKVASARTKLRSPAQTIRAAQVAKVARPAREEKRTTAKSKAAPKVAATTRVARAAKPEAASDATAQPRRVRIRPGNVELASIESQQRSRISTARVPNPANAYFDGEDDDQPVRRVVATPQRRAVNSYSSARLPAGCRDGSSSCEFTTSPNGNVTSVRSWRVSSSKRQ